MQDVRRKAHALAGQQRRVGQRDEAQVFIDVVGIEAAARIQLRAVDEVDHGAGAGQACRVHVKPQRMTAQLQRHVLQELDRPDFKRAAVYLRVERHEQPDVMAGRMQIFGQCARHVCQSTGFGQWRNFRGDKADPQCHGTSVAVTGVAAGGGWAQVLSAKGPRPSCGGLVPHRAAFLCAACRKQKTACFVVSASCSDCFLGRCCKCHTAASTKANF